MTTFSKLPPEARLGDAPIQKEFRERMVQLARSLDDIFNGETLPVKQVGFVLMVFPYGDTTGRCNYISNGANRQDVVALMKEMIARFEGQPEIVGHA